MNCPCGCRLVRSVESGELLETADCGALIGLNVEDRKQPRDLDQIVYALGQVDQLQFAARIANGRVGANKFADARAIDVIHIGEIEQNLSSAAIDELANHLAQCGAAFTERDFPTEVDDGDFTAITACTL